MAERFSQELDTWPVIINPFSSGEAFLYTVVGKGG